MPSRAGSERIALSPRLAALLWRAAVGALLCALWLTGDSGPAGIALLLCLAVIAILRARLPLPAWSTLADLAACAAATTFWPGAALAASLPVFDASVLGQPWLALPALALLVIAGPPSLAQLAALLLSAFVGWILFAWGRQAEADRLAADRDRRELYELEALRTELLSASAHSARTAELAERARIAADLHDNAGHDIVAAELALRAFESLWKAGDPEAAGMLAEAQDRLAGGMAALRATAHAMAPGRPIGAAGLEAICRRFTGCPVRFRSFGATDRVPAEAWAVLEPFLKEALTNSARHASASRVEVDLDVGPHIVRMSVANDGADGAAAPSVSPTDEGIGIRNLRWRAQALGGTVTLDAAKGFRIVCVLPLGEGEAPA